MRRAFGYLLAWFAFVVTGVAIAVRYVPVINHAVLFITGLAPLLAVGGGAVCASALLALRHRRWAAVPIVFVVWTIAAQLPLFATTKSDTGPSVRVLTFNAKEGGADPEMLAATARERSDLLAVQELTTELADELNERLGTEFPYRALNAGRGGVGTGIWSRHPIVSSRRIPGYQLGTTSATIRVPGAASDTVVLSVHLVGPWPYPIDGWVREIAQLRETLDETARAAGTGAAIVAGDFNATRSMAPYRRLLRDGYRDAVDQSRSGLTPTFPADRSFPPLIGIDHILTYNSSASGAETVRIRGSDHLGLVATVHLR